MIQFPGIHTYLTNYAGGVAVSTVSLWIIFQFFAVAAPLRQALWISALISFVNLIPFVEYFFPIPLLAYLLSRRGNLSGGGILIILVAWLALNTVFYTGLREYRGYKFTMELAGMQKIVQSMSKLLVKR
ncbi:MAG: hypothetical protein HY920_04600 [Elusimicrobia bacterium]|nr:hypothetical protein [Elusimicrobiota bacterium]